MQSRTGWSQSIFGKLETEGDFVNFEGKKQPENLSLEQNVKTISLISRARAGWSRSSLTAAEQCCLLH